MIRVVVCILIILLIDIVGITVLYRELLCDFWLWSVLVSGIASIFAVDYSSNFPTDDRPLIDFFTPL